MMTAGALGTPRQSPGVGRKTDCPSSQNALGIFVRDRCSGAELLNLQGCVQRELLHQTEVHGEGEAHGRRGEITAFAERSLQESFPQRGLAAWEDLSFRSAGVNMPLKLWCVTRATCTVLAAYLPVRGNTKNSPSSLLKSQMSSYKYMRIEFT